MLDAEVAADFLVGRTGDADRRAAPELAGELGGLPLALEQAAAYIQASGGSLARYLVIVPPAAGGACWPAASRPGTARRSTTTWSLAFTQLERSAPHAVGLLRLLACCAPEPIPLRLLLQPRPGLADDLGGDVAAVLVPLLEDELAVDDAVAALRRYSLVIPAGDGLVSVHRLVQAVTADQMPVDMADQWRQAAAALVEAAIPADPELPETWPVYAVLLPHARAVLDLTSGGMGRIADYLGQSGSYPAARDLWQLIADAYGEDDAYGPEHPNTLTARANLACWTGRGGGCGRGPRPVRRAAAHPGAGAGPRAPGALADRGGLAIWTGEAGDAAAARDQFAVAAAHPRAGPWARAPGHPDHPAQPGPLDREAGDAAGARDQLAALLPIQERVLGARHPDTLAARRNLAIWTGEAGDPPGARDLFAALLPVEERVLGSEHPNTLTVRVNLVYYTGQAGAPAAARDLSAELLPVRERVSGPEHPDTLTTRHEVAYWTGEAGNAAAARDLFAALLPVRERVSGPRAPGHPGLPRQPRPLDGRGGGRGRRPGPVRGAAAGARARLRPRAPGHPNHPPPACRLDREGRARP